MDYVRIPVEVIRNIVAILLRVLGTDLGAGGIFHKPEERDAVIALQAILLGLRFPEGGVVLPSEVRCVVVPPSEGQWDKISAIKAVREVTGLGLLEAKNIVCEYQVLQLSESSYSKLVSHLEVWGKGAKAVRMN